MNLPEIILIDDVLAIHLIATFDIFPLQGLHIFLDVEQMAKWRYSLVSIKFKTFKLAK